MPLISIIIPCFQQARFLPAAVSSALAQTGTDVEVIVVDDGSPDDPLGHLGPLTADTRVKVVRQHNAGLPAARNRGIAESRGSYLNFLDADDWLAPGFAAELSQFFQEDPALGIVYCDLQHVFEEGPPDPDKRDYSVGASRRNTSGDILPSLLLGGYFTPHCALVPRTVLDQVGLFDDQLGGHADWDLWLRIAVRGFAAAYVDKKLAFYRIHGRNMSSDREHMASTRLATLRKLFREYPEQSAAAIEDLTESLNETHRINLRLRAEFAALDGENRALQHLRDEDTARANAVFHEQREWIAKLEEARDWHLQQSAHWESETRRLLALGNEQRIWIEQLTARKDELESRLAELQESPPDSASEPPPSEAEKEPEASPDPGVT